VPVGRLVVATSATEGNGTLVRSDTGARTAGDVLRLIRAGRATTRADLVRETRLSRATLGSRLDTLLALNLVVPELAPSTGGRPPSQFRFNPAAGLVLAADLGASHARVALADLGGDRLGSQRLELAIADGPDAVLGRVLEAADALLGAAGVSRAAVWATGIGVPGPVDFSTGRPVRPPIMPGWDGFDIHGWWAERVSEPVLVDNDVNVMAYGEYWRRWRGAVDDLLYVKVGTGIGAGIISQGKVFRGARGTAGDIGHMRVQGDPGVVCDCGNEGCVEAVASGRALARELTALGHQANNTRDVVELAASGQADAVRAVREAGRRIGEVVAAAVNLLNPDVIVVGGGLAAAHDHLLAGIREVVYQRSTALATQSLRIEHSTLGDDAGVEGCLVLAMEHLLSTEFIDDLIERAVASSA
jgi:predicted NBD/HSP70 family sugar kinase